MIRGIGGTRGQRTQAAGSARRRAFLRNVARRRAMPAAHALRPREGGRYTRFFCFFLNGRERDVYTQTAGRNVRSRLVQTTRANMALRRAR